MEKNNSLLDIVERDLKAKARYKASRQIDSWVEDLQSNPLAKKLVINCKGGKKGLVSWSDNRSFGNLFCAGCKETVREHAKNETNIHEIEEELFEKYFGEYTDTMLKTICDKVEGSEDE